MFSLSLNKTQPDTISLVFFILSSNYTTPSLILFNQSKSLVLRQRHDIEVLLVDRLSLSTGEIALDPRFVEVHVCFLAGHVDFAMHLSVESSVDTPTDLEE
jgi:hypothetical protein